METLVAMNLTSDARLVSPYLATSAMMLAFDENTGTQPVVVSLDAPEHTGERLACRPAPSLDLGWARQPIWPAVAGVQMAGEFDGPVVVWMGRRDTTSTAAALPTTAIKRTRPLRGMIPR